MYPVSEELKRKLGKLNHSLREAYPAAAFDEKKIRCRLEEVGNFYQIEKWKDNQLKDWLAEKSLVGVDGSVNSTRGTQTRTLSVFQALAKGTKGEEKWAADVHTPLLDEDIQTQDGQAAREARQRGAILSGLEMTVTMQVITEYSPKVIMMDGSLLHFQIDDIETWIRLADMAEQHGVYLIGVSEEIGTRGLVKELFPEYPAWSDRDLLYGVLKVGEFYEWEDWSPAGSGLWKMAFRSSRSPQPIGLDGLTGQKERRFELVQLVYTLTPEQGRGIPFWLDIIDNQVRVTDPLVQTMVDQYIDTDLRHRLLIPKRSDRII